MVKIALSNRTDLNIRVPSMLEIANDTISIESLLLTSGFPFNEFLTPSIRFKSIKKKIYAGEWEGGCRTNISGGNIYNSLFNTVFNVPNKENNIIEGDCIIKSFGEDVIIDEVGQYNLASIFSRFGMVVDDTFDLVLHNQNVIPYLPASMTENIEKYGTIANFMYGLQGLKLSDCYIEIKDDDDPKYINYEMIKKIAKTLQWVGLNYAPTYSTVKNNAIWITHNVNYSNPFNDNAPITLNTDNIIKWKETKSKQGYELKSTSGYPSFRDALDETNFEEGVEFNIEATGDGVTHRFEGDAERRQIRISMDKADQPQLRASMLQLYYASAVGSALYYDAILGERNLEITTKERTLIVPYSKVKIEGITYYCTEAEIPYKDHDEYRYKLQEKIN